MELFLPSAKFLVEKLVDSWNHTARLQGESLQFLRLKGGWDWVACLETVDPSSDKLGETMIVVLLCSSESQALDAIRAAFQHSLQFGIPEVSRAMRPYEQFTDENLGFRRFSKWIDDMNEFGKPRQDFR